MEIRALDRAPMRTEGVVDRAPRHGPVRRITVERGDQQTLSARGEAIELRENHVRGIELETAIGIGLGSDRPDVLELGIVRRDEHPSTATGLPSGPITRPA